MVPLVAVLLAIATTTTALTLPPPHRLRVDQRLLSDGVLDATIAPVFSFEVPLSVADSAHRAADVSAYRIVVLQRGDHFAGFTPPRQLYAGDVYRVWGGLPWDDGDFFTHGVLNML